MPSIFSRTVRSACMLHQIAFCHSREERKSPLNFHTFAKSFSPPAACTRILQTCSSESTSSDFRHETDCEVLFGIGARGRSERPVRRRASDSDTYFSQQLL